MKEEFSTGAEFEDEIQLGFALESKSQFYNKWVLDVLLQDGISI
jgi:hypothetical protein